MLVFDFKKITREHWNNYRGESRPGRFL